MFRPKPLRPPFDPFLGQPHKLPPTPTLRQLQMQAAHRGRGPRGWQVGGAVRPLPPAPLLQGKGYGPYWNPPARFARGFAQGDLATADPREALMAEREMLQQQLQMADEVTAREIMAQIMEINKELEMAARNFGMAGGGLASLRGGGRPMNPRAVAAAARRRNAPPIPRPWTGPGLAPWESPYDPANPPRVVGFGGG